VLMWLMGKFFILWRSYSRGSTECKEITTKITQAVEDQIEKRRVTKASQSPQSQQVVSRQSSEGIPQCHPAEWDETLLEFFRVRALHRRTTWMFTARAFGMGIFFGCIYVIFFMFYIMTAPPEKEDVLSYIYSSYVFIGSVCIELGYFVMAAIMVHFQPRPKAANGIDTPLDPDKMGPEDVAEENPDNATCIFIATHKMCGGPEGREQLRLTLAHAVKVVPPRYIFVCDNSIELKPPDRTIDCVKEFSEQMGGDFNYLYMPVANKTISFAWALMRMVPALTKAGVCPDFKYVLMIDDDVLIPRNFVIPYDRLREEEKLSAIAYSIEAITPNEGCYNQFWVTLQEMEYNNMGVFKKLESDLGSTLCAHGAIAVWKADILAEEIFPQHDTEFFGEDMQMGVWLHFLGQGRYIHYDVICRVATAVPDTLADLWMQRWRSWDMAIHRNGLRLFAFMLTTCSPLSWIFKVSILLELFAVFCDWVRITFAVHFFWIAPVFALEVTGAFMVIAWIQLLIRDWIIYKHRPDHRTKNIAFFFTFPFYRIFEVFFFRQCALLENVLTQSPFHTRGHNVRTLIKNNRFLPFPKHLFPENDKEAMKQGLKNLNWDTIWVPDTPQNSAEKPPSSMLDYDSTYSSRLARVFMLAMAVALMIIYLALGL